MPEEDRGRALDPAALERLRRLGGDELTERMVGIFLRLGEDRLAAAREGLARSDPEMVERAAHSLRSSAGNVGARALVERAEAVERTAGRVGGAAVPAAETLAELVGRMEGEFGRVAGELRAIGPWRSLRKIIAHVEENLDNRLLVSAILEDRYRVVEYGSGPAALAGFREERPDLVLLDISMPGMDGTEVLARMRADPALAEVPVVALTAHAMEGDRERYMAQGFDGYVTKPIVDEGILLDAIERHLR